jgi:hypothetical protein
MSTFKVLFKRRIVGVGTFQVREYDPKTHSVPVLVVDLSKVGASRWDYNFDSQCNVIHEINDAYHAIRQKNPSVPQRMSIEVKYNGRFVSMVSTYRKED